MDHNVIAKLCENSRNLSSALSHDDDTLTSSTETRFRSFNRSRASSISRTISSRKNSKDSDEMIELSKTVQNGMADLSLYDEPINYKNSSPEEVQKKIEAMKVDLLNKIKNNEDPIPTASSTLRKYSTESIEEENETVKQVERPKSRGIRSSVSFYGNSVAEEVSGLEKGNGDSDTKLKRENSVLERKLSGKPLDKYCKDMIVDIEKSNKVIDRHMKELTSSKLMSDNLVQQLEAVDKINDYVNQKGDIPDETLVELNNNFKVLTSEIAEVIPVARKRSTSGRISSGHKNYNLFGDASMSNQDLLNDLLGKK